MASVASRTPRRHRERGGGLDLPPHRSMAAAHVNLGHVVVRDRHIIRSFAPSLASTAMESGRNEVVISEPTWVTTEEAARYAGVSRSTVSSLCAQGLVEVRMEGRLKLVPMEQVLSATTGKDIEALRRRLQRQATLKSAPDAVRDWAESLLGVLDPVLDRLLVAERRAAVAEAKVELLSRRLDAVLNTSQPDRVQ